MLIKNYNRVFLSPDQLSSSSSDKGPDSSTARTDFSRSYDYGSDSEKSRDVSSFDSSHSPREVAVSMTFFEAIGAFFRKYATFTGRARRKEFWFSHLAIYIVECIIGSLYFIVQSNVVEFLMSLLGAVLFIPVIAVSWRRLHDIGWAGGWWFLNCIPIIGQIILLICYCTDSKPGENKYGENPKVTVIKN